MMKKKNRLTSLQQEIIHTVAKKERSDTSEVSDYTGASPSYVRKVKSQFAEEINQIQRDFNLTYEVIFSEPYAIYIPPHLQEQFHIYDDDIAEITFEEGSEMYTTHGRVKVDDFLTEKMLPQEEVHARIIGCYQAINEIQEINSDLFSDFVTGGQIELPTSEAVQQFVGLIRHLSFASISDADILIGAGIVEIITDERRLGNLVENQLFKIEAEDYARYFLGEGPKLVNIELYMDEISEPDPVYFTYYGEDLQKEEIDEIRDQILDAKYFRPDWNYTLPTSATVVGPTPRSETEQLIKVTDDTLEVVRGVKQRISVVQDDSPSEKPNLTVSEVQNAIEEANPHFEDLTAHSRYRSDQDGLPTRVYENSILFIFDHLTLSLQVEEDTLWWQYPPEIDNAKKIKEAVTEMVISQLTLKKEYESTREPPKTLDSDIDWVFDTNTLYHDFVANEPTNIFHTLLSHDFFYQSNISIPWIVIYELNKHPDRGSATESTNTQGIENLNTMQFLDKVGFFDLNVESVPSEITSDVGKGDIADMYVLHFTKTEADCLLTADKSLWEVANIMEIPAINFLNILSSFPRTDRKDNKESVKHQIGRQFETREEIVNAIQDKIEPDITGPPVAPAHREQGSEPSDVFDSWIHQDEILPYYHPADDDIKFAQAKQVSVAIGESVLAEMDDFIEECNNKRYLTSDFLNQVQDSLGSTADFELPLLTFVVPISYIIHNATENQRPSKFNCTAFQLKQTVNSTYEPKSVLQSDINADRPLLESLSEGFTTQSSSQEHDTTGIIGIKDYLAVALAASSSLQYVILPEDHDHLSILSKLIGTTPISVSLPESQTDSNTS